LVYVLGKSGELKPTSPGPLDIRHAQIVAKYVEYLWKDPNLTETQLSEMIVVFFNHGSVVSKRYVRKIFDFLDDPLATKKGVSPDAVAASPATAPPAPLSPIDEGAGESGESSGSSAGAKSTWGAKG